MSVGLRGLPGTIRYLLAMRGRNGSGASRRPGRPLGHCQRHPCPGLPDESAEVAELVGSKVRSLNANVDRGVPQKARRV
jgi:hypothetical protein